MPKNGVASMFGFGGAFRVLEGVLAGVGGISIQFVRPQAWQKDPPRRDAPHPADTKERSVLAARRLFPTINLVRGAAATESRARSAAPRNRRGAADRRARTTENTRMNLDTLNSLTTSRDLLVAERDLDRPRDPGARGRALRAAPRHAHDRARTDGSRHRCAAAIEAATAAKPEASKPQAHDGPARWHPHHAARTVRDPPRPGWSNA
jgi:hypothetical protein